MSDHLGIGVRLKYMTGSDHTPEKLYGRTITEASIADNQLLLAFADGLKIAISDECQNCCEHRYMRTDDVPATLVGGILTKLEVKDGPNTESGKVHEVCFLEIATDKGFINISNHNEHNGYYGGFAMMITEVKA